MDESTRRVLDDLKAYEEWFLATPAPGPDPAALRQLQALLFRVQTSDAYLLEKKRKLLRDAGCWFSHRKWQQYPGGHASLKALVLGGLHSVREVVETIARRAAP